jgi:hypothetical protein
MLQQLRPSLAHLLSRLLLHAHVLLHEVFLLV